MSANQGFHQQAFDAVKQGADAIQQGVQVAMHTFDVNQACQAMGNAAIGSAQNFINGNLQTPEKLLTDMVMSDSMHRLMGGNGSGSFGGFGGIGGNAGSDGARDNNMSHDESQAVAMRQRASEVMARISAGSVTEGDLASLAMDICGKQSFIASGYTENAQSEGRSYLGKRGISQAEGRDYKADTQHYRTEDDLKYAINESKRKS